MSKSPRGDLVVNAHSNFRDKMRAKFNRAKYWSKMPLLSFGTMSNRCRRGCKRGASITEQWASCSAFRCGERVHRNPSRHNGRSQWKEKLFIHPLALRDHFTVWRRPLNKQTKAQRAWLGHPQKRNGNGEHRTHTEMDPAINFEPPWIVGGPAGSFVWRRQWKEAAPNLNFQQTDHAFSRVAQSHSFGSESPHRFLLIKRNLVDFWAKFESHQLIRFRVIRFNFRIFKLINRCSKIGWFKF